MAAKMRKRFQFSQSSFCRTVSSAIAHAVSAHG
jgi:hypothetical protein